MLCSTNSQLLSTAVAKLPTSVVKFFYNCSKAACRHTEVAYGCNVVACRCYDVAYRYTIVCLSVS
jgi:hypothetical protein